MTIPYRTRRFLKGLATALLALVLVLVLVWALWLLWLDRYVVYSRDGARLDFDLVMPQSGELATPPDSGDSVSIFYNEGEDALNTSTELGQLFGYYITTTMLLENPSQVLELLRELPEQAPVLIEMKDIVGRFYYQTELGPISESADMEAIGRIVEQLTRSNLYAIAKIPAFRDYNFGLNNVPYGLPHSSGRGLWMDESRCYWLNPASDGTVNFLVSIIEELKALGFDEVVLGDFRFPSTDKIKFEGNKTDALNAAAATLAQTCATERFCVSFLVANASFALPQGRTRMYMENQSASDVKGLIETAALEDPAVKMVFLTDLKDTRFEEYGVLRPITSFEPEES